MRSTCAQECVTPETPHDELLLNLKQHDTPYSATYNTQSHLGEDAELNGMLGKGVRASDSSQRRADRRARRLWQRTQSRRGSEVPED